MNILIFMVIWISAVLFVGITIDEEDIARLKKPQPVTAEEVRQIIREEISNQ